MATSEGIKQRPIEKPASTDAADADADKVAAPATSPTNKDRKIAKAKRGLRSLAVAVTMPVALSVTSAYLSGKTFHDGPDVKSNWQPPIIAFHLGNVTTAALMGLSAWLVWAKGGFHQRITDLLFYLGQLLLVSAWGPVVLRLQDARFSFAIAVGMLVCLFGCKRCFRRVSPLAGDLVMPCTAWALFLAIFSYSLI